LSGFLNFSEIHPHARLSFKKWNEQTIEEMHVASAGNARLRGVREGKNQ
jgi:hypothetical protein